MKLIQRQLLYFAAGVITTLTLMTIPRIFLETEQPHVNRRKKVVFFGDSITQHGFNCARSGWVSAMADWWTRRVDVLNRGFSGYNSRWGLKMLEVVILPEKPDLLTVFFGANDAIDQSVLQYVSLDEYKKNVKNIVAVVRQVIMRIRHTSS